MKKLFSVLLAAALLALTFAGCAQKDDTAIRLGGLTGPTTMGMVKLLSDAENGETSNEISFTIAGTADELSPKLVQGELDIAAVPLNLASILHNNTDGAVQLLAVNTLGVLYIVESGGETVQSLADLKGKTVYATGKGSTPEYALQYLLAQNGIDSTAGLTIEWKSEPAEIVALMAAGEPVVAMMPQPYVTVAAAQVEGLRVALDLTEEWDALGTDSRLLTAGLVARTEFVEKHPGAVAAFLEAYAASTEYVNANAADAAQLVEQYGIVKAAVAEKAIPYCNITYIDGAEMQEAVSGYLQVLFDQNPKAVGGALPGEDFYYGA